MAKQAQLFQSRRPPITTRYAGPTNTKGSRFIATCEAARLVLSYDYALGVDENHEAACRAVLAKLGWDGTWVGSRMYGPECVWVCLPRLEA